MRGKRQRERGAGKELGMRRFFDSRCVVGNPFKPITSQPAHRIFPFLLETRTLFSPPVALTRAFSYRTLPFHRTLWK